MSLLWIWILSVLAIFCVAMAGCALRHAFLPETPSPEAYVETLPFSDPQGRPMKNIWVCAVACTPAFSLRPSLAKVGERVFLRLDQSGADIQIYVETFQHKMFAIYPPDELHFLELVERLSSGEHLFAMLFDKQNTQDGWRCEIKVVVYQQVPI